MSRNRDILEIKLGNMVTGRIQENDKLFEGNIKKIAENVAESIRCEEYERNDELLEALEKCKDCAKTDDAVDNLCKYIFYNEDCKSLQENVLIKTIECNRWNYEYDEFRNNIETIFVNENLNIKKGFVYIFWSASPLKYLYVGKTNPKNGNPGFSRLKQGNHNNVALSSREATKLTIIYPNRSDRIKDVEASIIRIIGKEKLTYNKKKESFSEGNGQLSKRFSQLKNFLKSLVKS
jgi:hypothetical protein